MKHLKLCALGILALCGGCIAPLPDSSVTSSPQTVPTAQTPTSEKSDGVTLEMFNQIQPGMSLTEAEEILGPGTEMSRVEIEGLPKTVMYQWDGAAFASNMNAQFQGGELITKAQFGLK